MRACTLRSMPWMMALSTGAACGVVLLAGVWSLHGKSRSPRVSGRVTYAGQASDGGVVIFLPSDRIQVVLGSRGHQP